MAKSWDEIARRFETYLSDKASWRPVFKSPEGEQISIEPEYRGSAKRSRKRYRQILQGERAFLDRAENPHTILLTLTCPLRDSDGTLHRPAERHLSIKEGWDHARKKLRYELGRKRNLDYEYAWVMGASNEGRAIGSTHLHVEVLVDGQVSTDTLAPVLGKYIDKNPLASKQEHPPGEAIKVRSVEGADLKPIGKKDVELGEVSPAARYIGDHLPAIGCEQDVREASPEKLRHEALLWACNSRSFGTSSGYPSGQEAEAGEEWDYIGVSQGGELYEGDGNSGSTSPDMIETSSPEPMTPTDADMGGTPL